jgi:hypothetical protein
MNYALIKFKNDSTLFVCKMSLSQQLHFTPHLVNPCLNKLPPHINPILISLCWLCHSQLMYAYNMKMKFAFSLAITGREVGSGTPKPKLLGVKVYYYKGSPTNWKPAGASQPLCLHHHLPRYHKRLQKLQLCNLLNSRQIID